MIDRRSFLAGAGGCVVGCLCRGSDALGQQQGRPRICTELVMSDVRLASAIANNENPKNQPIDHRSDNAEALSLTEKKWHPDRRILNVDFVDSPSYIDKIIKAATGWHDAMAMRFQFGKGSPDILVGFAPGGSWSYIGTDSTYYSRKGVPSMNFGWFDAATDDIEFRRTTLHEFGHALSLVHEHQHTGAKIKWKKIAVYAYYKNQGWNRADVDRNIFSKYEVTQVNGSAYDPTSIMHYPVDASLIEDVAGVIGWNTELSQNDRKVVAELYGRPGGRFPQ